MTIWLNARLSSAIAVWITATFGDIHQRSSDRRYFSILLDIVPQLRYNYKLSSKILHSSLGTIEVVREAPVAIVGIRMDVIEKVEKEKVIGGR
ncbi:MAG: hypothetical protein ACBR12_05765 [Microcoleus sp.]